MRRARLRRLLVWGALGVCTGVLAHHLLYRIGLPLKPFIYVSF